MQHAEQERLVRRTLSLARSARRVGNHPFGALLADANGAVLLEAENTTSTGNDCTAHAEMNLVRAASRTLTQAQLATTTLVSSTEPCPMCAGALYWAGVARLVFGLSQSGLCGIVGLGAKSLLLPCRDVLAGGEVEVVGPVIEAEALAVHEGFWNQGSQVEPG